MRNLLILLATVAIVATGTSYITRKSMDRACACPSTAEDSYAALNKLLVLTDSQKGVILKLEEEFETKENALHKALDTANRTLAATLASEGDYTPKVEAAVEHVHLCMGELQKASIAHLFEINRHLDPNQREKLMQCAGVALGNIRDNP